MTREQAETLIRELPKHLRVVARFSLETGLRKANVTGLEWAQVDLARRAIPVPLSHPAGPACVEWCPAHAIVRHRLPVARFTLGKPWLVGLCFLIGGLGLVAVAIALGG